MSRATRTHPQRIARVRTALSRPYTNRNVNRNANRLSRNLRQEVLMYDFETRHAVLLSQLRDEWWQSVVVGRDVAADKPPGICSESQLLV